MTAQAPLFDSDAPPVEAVMEAVRDVLDSRSQPSAWELLEHLGAARRARWSLEEALAKLDADPDLSRAQKDYLRQLRSSDDWGKAMRGGERPAREVESTVDALLRASVTYRDTCAFQEMISFMANFRDYAPFNNMLVRLQRPSCSFYATQRDWANRFERTIKEDALPLVILAPMHPVMLVYDLDSTEGAPLPEELVQFARFDGDWDEKRLSQTIENAVTRDLTDQHRPPVEH